MAAPATTTSHDSFRPDVEGLRGIAVVVVVLFHARLFGLTGGFVGVDVFFVISGFLITGLLLREHERTGRIALIAFYARRARRLLPAALVVLVLTTVAAANLVAPLDRREVGLDGAAAALSIGNLRFALAAGDYFLSVSAPSPFLHFWSLAVEEQFYLVWPALILLVAGGVHARQRLAVALLAIVIGSLALNLMVTDAAANWAFYSLPTRAWELGLGGLLAVGSGTLAKVRGWIVGLVGWFGLAAVALATLAFDASLAYPGAAALVPSIGAAALLAGGSRRLGPGRLLSAGPLRFLGKISYSLYLVHWPILVLAPLAIGDAPTEVTQVGLVLLSVAAAIVSWALIETPFRTGLPRLALQPGRTVSIGVAAVLAVVVVAAGPYVGFAPTTVVAADQGSLESFDPTDEGWSDETPSPPPSATPAAPGSPSLPPATPSVTPSPSPTPAITPTPDIANSGALPRDVAPALSRARNDEERLRVDGCLAFERVTKPPTCVYGVKAASFTVALVGDSHAAQWFPAVERLAKHEGWQVVTFVKVACPFIDMPVRNLALKREYRECAEFNEATIARLRTLKPDLTLVSMSRIATRPMKASDDTVEAKAAAVARMLSRVSGKTTLIVDTPYATIDVPGCLSSHQGNIDACAIPRPTAFYDHLGSVEKAASRASGAGLINLTPRICVGPGECSVVVNGMIVYRDHSHLTATFSRSLAPALAAAVTALLGA